MTSCRKGQFMMRSTLLSILCCGLFTPVVIAQSAPDDAVTITGRVLSADGTPVPDTTVRLNLHRDIGVVEATTDAEGRFTFSRPWDELRGRVLQVSVNDSRLQSVYEIPWQEQDWTGERIDLTLQPARRIEIEAVDGDGTPVSGARAGVICRPGPATTGVTGEDGRFVSWLAAQQNVRSVYAFASGEGFDYRSYELTVAQRQDPNAKPPELPNGPIRLTLDGVHPVTVQVVDDDGKPMDGVPIYPWILRRGTNSASINLSYVAGEVTQPTDAAGNATFEWLPAWQERPVTFWPHIDGYVRRRGSYDPNGGGGELTIRLQRLVPMRGRVVHANGEPAAGAIISVVGRGYDVDGLRKVTTTDAEGRYEIAVAPDMIYLVTARNEKERLAAAPQTGFAVRPGEPVDGIDFTLQPATRVHGRVMLGRNHEGVKDQQIVLYLHGTELSDIPGLTLPNPEEYRTRVMPQQALFMRTDSDGIYTFWVGPGRYSLRGPVQVSSGNGIHEFEVTDEEELSFNFRMLRPPVGRLTGRVVMGDPPRPVPDARIEAVHRHPRVHGDLKYKVDGEGRFDFERQLVPMTLYARTEDGTFAGIVEIGPDEMAVTIPLQPTAAVRGRLVDGQTKQPVAGRNLVWGVQVFEGEKMRSPFRHCFGGGIQSAEDGTFTLFPLVVGQTYDLTGRYPSGNLRFLTEIHAEDGSLIDLGDVELKPEPEPYRPPTIEERIAQAFAKDADEQLASARRDIPLTMQNLLVLFGDPTGDAVRQFYELRYDSSNRDMRTATYEYRIVAVSAAGDQRAKADDVAKSLGVNLDDGRAAFFGCVVDPDGSLLATVEAAELSTEGEMDAAKVLGFLEAHRPPRRNAHELLEQALATAKAENRRVIIQETATWCGPCIALSRFLDEHREVWEKDYLWIKLDHRWEGSREIADRLRDGASGGIPWWAILDADGEKLVTSNKDDGDNIGNPSSPSGQAHFRIMLNKTAIRMTEEEIDGLIEALRER
ncbi:Nickel uptake substrate-specific transmembrane region [Maioricimonas rarisocia]|uniref:Nickel uptake substrate-specific transmembrane region n=1 Tax=Maioricimonas rarisocia TaxID=2528026 RepID=A0A517Z1D7_9PLAN|nr:carboxypeptidase regulatory-like domain-containing protein [Maioricimonas rarisocia]QDU36239.1 Nickel uptake substrate-specific transmembrane region [Maioricimonas rarisocia]